jgi:hypothetical protein
MSLEEIKGNPNIPGLYELKFVDVRDVVSIPRKNADGIIETDIVLASGKTWLVFPFTVDSLDYRETPIQNEQGILLRQQFKGSFPKGTPANVKELNRMNWQRFLVLGKDRNGYERLIGTLGSPARFSWNYSSGKKGGDPHSFDISFTAHHKDAAAFYQANVVVQTCPDAIVKNTAGTTLVVVKSGNTAILADVTHTDSDGSPVAKPMGVAMICTPGGGGGGDVTIYESDGVTVIAVITAPGSKTMTGSKVFKSDGVTLVILLEDADNYSIPKHSIFKSDGLTLVVANEFDQNHSIPKHIIYKSDGITVVVQQEFDQNYSIPKHIIYKSDGSTVVVQQEFDQNYSIPKHTIYESDGVTVHQTDEFDQDFTLPAGGSVTIYESDGVTVIAIVAAPGTKTMTGSKVFKSDGVTLVILLEDADNYSIPKHNIFKSDGLTLVVANEFDVDYSIAKHIIYKSDGVTVVVQQEFDQNYSIPKHGIYKNNGSVLVQNDEFDVDFWIPKHNIYNPDGSLLQQDEYDQNFTIPADIEIKFSFQDTHTTMTHTVDSYTAGTYDVTSITSSNAGTITIKKNGVTQSGSFSVVATDTIECIRTTSTPAGWVILPGTY